MSSVEELRAAINQLNSRKENVITESEAIISELTLPPSNGAVPMGVDTPLVDAEGFPRNDIDILRARTLRSRLGELRTDHNMIMEQLDSHLKEVAAMQNQDLAAAEKKEAEQRKQKKPKPKYDPVSGKWVVRNWDGTLAGASGTTTSTKPRSFDTLQEVEVNTPATTQTVHRVPRELPDTPLATVESVALNSPAEQAKLQTGDLILAFGPIVAWKNEDIAGLVQQAGQAKEAIELAVKRGEMKVMLLRLEPKPWVGQGLLGCHIVPFHL